MRVIAAVGAVEFPIAERALQAVDREWRCRNDQSRHESRRNGKLLLDKILREPGGDSHHSEGDKEEAHAAKRLPSECDKRRDAADRNHPAEVIKQMVERELRASDPFGLEEGPEGARLCLANDAALGGSLELDPFDAHGKIRVSTTKPTLPYERAATEVSGRNATPAAERRHGKGWGLAGYGPGSCGCHGVIPQGINLRRYLGERGQSICFIPALRSRGFGH